MKTVAIGFIAAIVLLAVLLLRLILRRRRAASHALPPLFIPLPANTTAGPAIIVRKPPTPPSSATPPHGSNGANGTTPVRAAHPSHAATPPRPATARTPAPPGDESFDPGQTVRFYRPGDNAVQLLPGRLEVLAGETPLREIRFVRIPGEPPHLILGRDPGPSPQHVGLGSSTVSRRHARLDYSGRAWEVRNLSRTNPVVVNDDELLDTDAARPLADGDRLELGEVVLRFHAH